MWGKQVWRAEDFCGDDPRPVGDHHAALVGERAEAGELLSGCQAVLVSVEGHVGVSHGAGGGLDVEVVEFSGYRPPNGALVAMAGTSHGHA